MHSIQIIHTFMFGVGWTRVVCHEGMLCWKWHGVLCDYCLLGMVDVEGVVCSVCCTPWYASVTEMVCVHVHAVGCGVQVSCNTIGVVYMVCR